MRQLVIPRCDCREEFDLLLTRAGGLCSLRKWMQGPFYTDHEIQALAAALLSVLDGFLSKLGSVGALSQSMPA